MNSAILALAILAHPNNLMTPRQVSYLLVESKRIEEKYHLPESLLVAVVLAESGGRLIVARGRGKRRAGCDVGPAQVHVPGCESSRMRRLLVLSVNLEESAKILKWSESKCVARPEISACRRSRWALYNGGSKTWWARVEAILDYLRGYDERRS